jgi:hypothetical protein
MDAGARAAGVIFWLVIASGAGYGAWWFWPSGVTDVPLSSLTLGLIGRAGSAAMLGVIALGAIGGALSDAFD